MAARRRRRRPRSARAAPVGLPPGPAATSTTPTRTRTSSRARSGCSGTPTTRTTSSTRPPTRTCCTSRSRLRFGGRGGVSHAYAADPGDVFAVARRLGRARRGRRRAAGVGRRAAVRPPRRPRRGGAARRRVPARALRALRAQRRARRSRRSASRSSASAACYARRRSATTRSPAPGSGSPAPRSTRAGSCCCLLAAAAVAPAPAAGLRIAGLALAGVLALAAFLIANPFALLDFHAFRDGLSEQSAASSDGGGKLGLTDDSGILYYLGTTTWGLGWLPALAALGGRRRAGRARLAPGGRARPPRRPLPRLHGHPGPLLRALAAAGLPAAVPARRLRRRRARDVGARARAAAAAGVGGGRGRRPAVRAGARVRRSTTTSCSPAPTPGSWRATGWSRTSRPGSKVVIEPVVPDQLGERHRARAAARPATARAGSSGRPRARA